MENAILNAMTKKAGFTLTELMIVVAIVAVLAAIAIPQFEKFIGKTKRTEGILLLKAIHNIQVSYFSSHDKYLRNDSLFYPPEKKIISQKPKFYFQESSDLQFYNGPNNYMAFLFGYLDPDWFWDWLCIVYPEATDSSCDCGQPTTPPGVVILYWDDLTNMTCEF